MVPGPQRCSTWQLKEEVTRVRKNTIILEIGMVDRPKSYSQVSWSRRGTEENRPWLIPVFSFRFTHKNNIQIGRTSECNFAENSQYPSERHHQKGAAS